jgi:hypothetical protein
MAAPSYSSTIDTLHVNSLRGLNATFLNYVRQTTSPLHARLANLGNVVGHEQTEDTQNTLVYAASEAATRSLPDAIVTGNLATTAADPVTIQRSTFLKSEMNINYATGLSVTRMANYVKGRLHGQFGQWMDEQERLVVTGAAAGTNAAANAPFRGDTGFSGSSLPVSIKGMLHLGVNLATTEGAPTLGGADLSANVFMGIKVDDVGEKKGQPWFKLTGDATGANILDDVDGVARRTYWGASHHSTDIIMSEAAYNLLRSKYRDKAALPNPMAGGGLAIPIEHYMHGNLVAWWSRDLLKDADWDPQAAPAAHQPVIVANLKAFKLKMWQWGGGVIPGTPTEPGLSWLYDIGTPMIPHAGATAVFKRVMGVAAYDFESFRGTWGQVIGYTF